jgi:predicted ATPase
VQALWDGSDTILYPVVNYLYRECVHSLVKDKVNVITAGPSAGKSSTIRELSARGYRTLPEAARILFDQAISEGVSPEEKRKQSDFHEQVEAIDAQIESRIPDNEVVFLDRSIVDNLAYRKRFGSDNRPEIAEAAHDRYDNIFILERIDFQDDEVRVEDEDEAQKTHEAIVSAYRALGYETIEVPLMPVDERADFIESEIEHPEPIH